MGDRKRSQIPIKSHLFPHQWSFTQEIIWRDFQVREYICQESQAGVCFETPSSAVGTENGVTPDKQACCLQGAYNLCPVISGWWVKMIQGVTDQLPKEVLSRAR